MAKDSAQYHQWKADGRCSVCGKDNPTEFWACDPCRAANNKSHRNRRDQYRDQAYEKYGGKCACCGVDDWHFLTIDHIRGDGLRERRGGSGTLMFYKSLALGPVRDDLKILCMNCHMSKDWYGECPHQQG